VPCYNEQTTVGLLLQALYAQTYPRSCLEVVIADGLSTDQTRERIADFQKDHPDLSIRVLENPRRIIPAGLNQAIEAARGEVLIRLDGHSVPRPEYVKSCVRVLYQGLGDNVGGAWEIRPRDTSWSARAVAAAAAHPLGVGDARYRIGGPAQPVETVPFGAFRRDLISRVGPFNESLLTNEDYEFNTRIRQAGGTVWFDPDIRSTYYAPGSFGDLARQYARYGYWKARMLRRYPHTVRWRQALPPLFVLALFVLPVLGIWLAQARWVWYAQIVLYAASLMVAGLLAALQKKDLALLLGLPIAVVTMHLAWGAAFLWSLITSRTEDRRPEPA
jgi:cellulose synthase/poly-beta-1,6-N-acetylglucosamine synthase-like glycosyltransferase